jgi:hypothetical protein
MPLVTAYSQLARLFTQRCFYLFAALVLLICLLPFFEGAGHGRFIITAANLFIMLSAVAAMGKTIRWFIAGLLLAIPTIVFHLLHTFLPNLVYLPLAQGFGLALYLLTLVSLLGYVLRPEVMTGDKLWGAAAAFMLLGFFWAMAYALIQSFKLGAFALGGNPSAIFTVTDLVYFSFTVLTSTGFGDIAPVTGLAKSVCVLEEISGVLFLTIMIARLAGIYPPTERQAR